MRKILTIICLFVFFVSCSKKPAFSEEDAERFDNKSIDYVYENFYVLNDSVEVAYQIFDKENYYNIVAFVAEDSAKYILLSRYVRFEKYLITERFGPKTLSEIEKLIQPKVNKFQKHRLINDLRLYFEQEDRKTVENNF